MKDMNIGIAVTLTVGSVALTVELKKNDSIKDNLPLKIEPVKNGGYIECKKDND